jgi:NTF2 fold immunity protein of polymorphic toxin system component
MKSLLCIWLSFGLVGFAFAEPDKDQPDSKTIEKVVAEALQQKTPVTNYDKPIVPTAEVAVGIHKAVVTGIYGRDIGQEPFRAVRSGGFWVVYGDLPKGSLGGVPVTVIQASDGKVIWVTSGQ